MRQFRPMLAATCEDADWEKLRLPMLASPKIDGLRCVIRDGVPLTRTLKRIPNNHIFNRLTGLPDFDGEIVVGDPLHTGVWNVTSSGVMSRGATPDFTYLVFDLTNFEDTPGAAFSNRLILAEMAVKRINRPYLQSLPHVPILSLEELRSLEAAYVRQGFEGIMLRDPDGKYKFGRSTMREQGLIKIKRVHDDEAKITGFEELMINANAPQINELGLKERSTRQDGLVPGGTLGALICQHKNGKPFKIGTGYDEATRRRLWKRRYYLSGKYVKYKYQELTPDGIPRFPVYKGLPAEEELEEIHPTTMED